MITNPKQTEDLAKRQQNGELLYLRQTVVIVKKENEYGLEPGEYLAYEYEEKYKTTAN